ncbi:hypothetical protein CCP2SC5_660013 [Azospirillaceae bacterium]
MEEIVVSFTFCRFVTADFGGFMNNKVQGDFVMFFSSFGKYVLFFIRWCYCCRRLLI